MKPGFLSQRVYILILEAGRVFRSQSVTGELFRSYTPSYILNKVSSARSGYIFNIPPNQLQLQFGFDNLYFETSYTPESLFSGLTRLGALIALSRIFIFFTFYHEWRFERQLQREITEGGEGVEVDGSSAIGEEERMLQRGKENLKVREVFSFRGFMEMHQAFSGKLRRGLNQTASMQKTE
jgi:hypothetical protein